VAPSSERERVATLFFYVAVLGLAYLVFQIFRPFFAPLGWAAVVVILCHRWHARLEARLGPTRAAALSTGAVAIMLVVPALILMRVFVTEGIQAVGGVQRAFDNGQFAWAGRALHAVQRWLAIQHVTDLSTITDDMSQRAATMLASHAASLAQNVVVVIAKLGIMLFATFFLFRDAASIREGIRRALPFEDGLRTRMIAQAEGLVSASVTAGVIVAGTQGLLGGIAFTLVGIGAPVFWGIVMAFFCLLPLGAWVIWLPASIVLLASGHIARGVVLLVLGIATVSAVDNVLRPALISGRSRMNGLLVFISLLGGIGLFGALGIILGPILVATATGLLEAYTEDRT
jgi:predicted PurR-regulated permease PerM